LLGDADEVMYQVVCQGEERGYSKV
jgi:hypothetical protein